MNNYKVQRNRTYYNHQLVNWQTSSLLPWSRLESFLGKGDQKLLKWGPFIQSGA